MLKSRKGKIWTIILGLILLNVLFDTNFGIRFSLHNKLEDRTFYGIVIGIHNEYNGATVIGSNISFGVDLNRSNLIGAGFYVAGKEEYSTVAGLWIPIFSGCDGDAERTSYNSKFYGVYGGLYNEWTEAYGINIGLIGNWMRNGGGLQLSVFHNHVENEFYGLSAAIIKTQATNGWGLLISPIATIDKTAEGQETYWWLIQPVNND